MKRIPGIICTLLSCGMAVSVIAADSQQSTSDLNKRAKVYVDGLTDRDYSVVRDSKLNLIRMGASAVPEMRKALATQQVVRMAIIDRDVREEIIDVIIKIGPAGKGAIPELLALPDNLDGAQALGAIGPSAIPALAVALSNDDKNVRNLAVRALWWMDRKAEGAVPALTKALNDPEPDVRSNVYRTLGNIGPAAKGSVPGLLENLNKYGEDTDHPQCKEIVEAAGLIGPSAIAVLERGLTCSVWEAARALGKMGPAATPMLVKAFMTDPDKVAGTVDASAYALQKLGPKAESAIPALVKVLDAKDRTRSTWACEILGKIGPNGVPALIKALGHEDSDVRAHAAEALGGMGPQAKAASKALNNALSDSDANVRRAAAKALDAI